MKPKTKNGQTARQRKKMQLKQLAKQPQAKELADDPLADVKAEDEELYSFDDFLHDNPEDEKGIDEEGAPAVEEKCMDTFAVIDLDPPTDFDDLEAEREAADQAWEIRTTGWDAEMLLSNIVHHPVLDPEEKEEKIKKVAGDFATRLTDIVQDSKEFVPTEKDMGQVEAEMWASLAGNIGLGTKFAVTKAKLSKKTLNSLPDSAFAVVSEGKRMFPLHDEAHIRTALVAIPLMMKSGGDNADIAAVGLPKVVAAAKELGIGKAGEERINGLVVEKDNTGTYRWIGWVSNNFRDREKEIISEAAHKDFVEYLDANPEQAPEFWTWHTRGTARESKADAWLYHEGFVIMSGPLTDIEAYRLMKGISSDDIGMSHGFFALKDPDDPSIITKYRAYEVSDLPLDNAANAWTNIETQLKEVSSMSKKIDYLKTVTSEEFVDGLLAKAEENKEILVELGIESKEVEKPETETPETPEEEVLEEESPKELTKKQKKALEEVFGQDVSEIKQFVETAGKVMPLMAEKIVSLEKQVSGFEETKADALADFIGNTPASKAKALANRPSQNKKNIPDEKEEIDEPSTKAGGKDDWWGTYIEREDAEEQEV